MKFLCDVHIPFFLVKELQSAGHECIHVNNILQGSKTKDSEIIKYADKNGLVLISKDADFKNSFLVKCGPKHLVKVNLGNIPNKLLVSRIFENLQYLEILCQKDRFMLVIDPSETSYLIL